MSENRECTKAMAAIEARLGQRRSAVITRDEFGTLVDAYMYLRAYHKSFKEAQE